MCKFVYGGVLIGFSLLLFPVNVFHKLIKIKNQIIYRNVQSRYSNITVTLIVHSLKYSNRRVTKKTEQLQSIHPIEGSPTLK